jgi:hypothetical protein
VVGLSFVGLQLYLMRAKQGMIKTHMDSGGTGLYSPKHSTYMTLTYTPAMTVTTVNGPQVIRVTPQGRKVFTNATVTESQSCATDRSGACYFAYTSTVGDTAQVTATTGGGMYASNRRMASGDTRLIDGAMNTAGYRDLYSFLQNSEGGGYLGSMPYMQRMGDNRATYSNFDNQSINGQDL